MSRRLAQPMAVTADGTLATVEQDSDADITQCLRALLKVRVGDRADLPDMGLPDLGEFGEQPLELDAVRDVLAIYEPRVTAVLTQHPGLLEQLVAEVQVAWDTTPDRGTEDNDA